MYTPPHGRELIIRTVREYNDRKRREAAEAEAAKGEAEAPPAPTNGSPIAAL